MILVFQPDLIERVVFDAARADGQLARQYRRQFASCYEAESDEQRDRQFRELHERWFTELGLRDRITNVLAEFQHVQSKVARVVVASAGSPNLQSMELFGAPSRFTVAVAVAPATLLDPPLFGYWARHELFHIDDMLDPDFQYDRHAQPSGPSPAAKNLGRDRYAVLWAISVDARLKQRGLVPEGVMARRRAELARAWGWTDVAVADQAFDHLWTQLVGAGPSHPELLNLTNTLMQDAHTLVRGSHPAPILAGNPSRIPAATPPPGTPCPLCKFTTFVWADGPRLESIQAQVQGDFPDWRPAESLCGRCAEVYLARREFRKEKP